MRHFSNGRNEMCSAGLGASRPINRDQHQRRDTTHPGRFIPTGFPTVPIEGSGQQAMVAWRQACKSRDAGIRLF
jgi:hypothetical protein